MKTPPPVEVIAKNKKASFQYSFLEKYTAGIQLWGSEIKSIRNRKVSINEGYCSFTGDELFVINMHIAPYLEASYINHEPTRNRKLLLQRKELSKILKKVKIKGFTPHSYEAIY